MTTAAKEKGGNQQCHSIKRLITFTCSSPFTPWTFNHCLVGIFFHFFFLNLFDYFLTFIQVVTYNFVLVVTTTNHLSLFSTLTVFFHILSSFFAIYRLAIFWPTLNSCRSIFFSYHDFHSWWSDTFLTFFKSFMTQVFYWRRVIGYGISEYHNH